MNHEKAYKDAVSKIKSILADKKKQGLTNCLFEGDLNEIFPELASEDEMIRKELLEYINKATGCKDWLAWLEKQGEPQTYKGDGDAMRKNLIAAFKSVGSNYWGGFDVRDILHWLESKDAIELERQGDYNKLVEEIKERKELLSKEKEKATSTNDKLSLGGRIAMLEELLVFANEKQGDTNETINRDKFAQGVLKDAAINLITWIDYNAAEGNMCLSNMECKDIEDALVSGNWGKIYAYIKKKLEKKGEQKPAWSDDDEKMMLYVLNNVSVLVSNYDFENIQIWFKSIKKRLKGE